MEPPPNLHTVLKVKVVCSVLVHGLMQMCARSDTMTSQNDTPPTTGFQKHTVALNNTGCQQQNLTMPSTLATDKTAQHD